MKAKRVLIIDAEKREIREGTVDGLDDMQAIVGGLICHGLELENGDEIMVNDEGLLGRPQHFFYYDGAHQPFAMNGFVTGHPDDDGDTTDAKTTVEELTAKIKWMEPIEVLKQF